MKQLNKLKKLPLLLALVGVLAIPMVMRAYAQEDTPQVQEETTTTEEPVVQEETPTPETPVVEPPVETPEVPAPTPEDPDTTVTDDGVSLGEAQTIATTEHPGSTIKQSKIKTIDGNAVYAFYFEDGWKVYVRATDGVVVEVKDPANNNHGCQNKHKDNAQFQAWLQEHKQQRKEKKNKSDDNNNQRKSNRSSGWSHKRR